MKKFTFSLEKILKLRSHAENDAKIELGRAVSALSRIENGLEAVAAAQKSAGEERFSEGNSLSRALDYENYLQRLDAEKERLLQEAAAAELAVERSREAWLDARAGLKALENLKNRKFAAYRKENGKAQ
ncbi:MAG: flagellar export protein FliJ [Spirochaetaceae bacterium]|nr:flagellar export protein FliJ [Spirochaetaceae bacterium]